MIVRMRYEQLVYEIESRKWRGPDGHTVHFLTWLTDDLLRRTEPIASGPEGDLEIARRVVDQLGSEKAEVEVEDDPV